MLKKFFSRLSSSMSFSSSSSAKKSIGEPSPSSLDATYEFAGKLSEVLASPKGLLSSTLTSSGRKLVLVSHKGSFRGVLDGLCPHKAADMSLGDIEDTHEAYGLCIKCPKHRKRFPGGLNFRLDDGQSWYLPPCESEEYDPSWKLAVHKYAIVEDSIYVSVAPSLPLPPQQLSSSSSTNVSSSSGSSSSSTTASASASNVTTTSSTIISAASSSSSTTASGVKATARYEKKSNVTWFPCRIDRIEKAEGAEDSSIYHITRHEGGGEGGGFIPREPARCDPHSWHLSLQLSRAGGGGVESEGAPLIREYTPISPLSEWLGKGGARLLIRHYPLGGGLTAQLLRATPGDAVSLSCETTTLDTEALLLEMERERARGGGGDGGGLLLIAGGTGVTPILQLAQWARCAPPLLAGSSPTSSLGNSNSATAAAAGARVGAGAGAGAEAEAVAPLPPFSFVAIIVSSRIGASLLDREFEELAKQSGSENLLLLNTRTSSTAVVGTSITPTGVAINAAASSMTSKNVLERSGRISTDTISEALRFFGGTGSGPAKIGACIISGPEGMMTAARDAVTAAVPSIPSQLVICLDS